MERVEHSFRSSNGAPPARAESATRFEWFLVYSELHLDEIQVYILMPLIARYRRLRRVDFAGQRASSSASASFRAVFLLQATRRGWPTAASTIFHVDSVEKKKRKRKRVAAIFVRLSRLPICARLSNPRPEINENTGSIDIVFRDENEEEGP